MSPSPLQQRLLDLIARLPRARVGVIGDLVADCYVSGLTERVSREAPVLILRYEQEWLKPGGAANVAVNLAALGAATHLVGLVGGDDTGRKMLAELGRSPQLHCSGIVAAPDRQTITKTRFLAGARLTSRQQVLRLDRQPDAPPDDVLTRELAGHLRRLDAQVDAWIVSDYGYGMFNAELRELMRDIARRKPVVADSRYELHQFRGMTLIKPNEEEAQGAARRLGLSFVDDADLARRLAARLEAQAALVTLGNKGMVLCADGPPVHIPAVGGVEIVDLTGAGDSVAATLTAALAAGAASEDACRLANHAGAIVVMKEGVATASLDELRESVLEREGS